MFCDDGSSSGKELKCVFKASEIDQKFKAHIFTLPEGGGKSVLEKPARLSFCFLRICESE